MSGGELCWLALVGEPPADATAWARTDCGEVLAAWLRHAKPVRHARRADPRIVDPDGPAASVSLVLPPAGVELAFDDLAVQQARRALLAGAPFAAVTALLRDASHFEGSLLVAPPDERERLRDDPFARIWPARRLEVEPGLLAAHVPWPAGPVIERYGSAQPWPADRF